MHVQLNFVLHDLLQGSKILQHQARSVTRSAETQAGVIKTPNDSWRHGASFKSEAPAFAAQY